MGIKKYRDDIRGEKQKNGGIPFFTHWMWGPSLSLIRDCETPFGRRTVYVQGAAETFFSIPAAIEFRRRKIHGFVSMDDDKNYVFTPYRGKDSIFPYT